MLPSILFQIQAIDIKRKKKNGSWNFGADLKKGNIFQTVHTALLMPAFCRIYLVPIQSSLHLHRELKTTHIFLQMWRKIYLYFNVSLSCVLRSTCCWFQVGCLSYGILFFLVFRSYIAPKQAASILNTFPITSLARGQLWSYVSVVRAHLHRLSPAPVRLLCITTCLLVGHHWDRSNQ